MCVDILSHKSVSFLSIKFTRVIGKLHSLRYSSSSTSSQGGKKGHFYYFQENLFQRHWTDKIFNLRQVDDTPHTL